MNNDLDVLYVDNHLLVVNKPAGILTQPSGTEQDSLERWARDWVKKTYQKPGNVFLGAAHRLDKPVSGVVVFGRTSKALSRLNTFIREKQTKKIYRALVEGCPSSPFGLLEHFIIHEEFRAHIVHKDYPNAKLARLTYRLISQHGSKALLEIELETGRYHQIRLQLSSIGCPIIGDRKYGSKIPFEGEGIALHHFWLRIPHPISRELLSFKAPLPASFLRLL